MKEIFAFLESLKLNNNREWFNLHRQEYELARERVLAIAEILIREVRSFDAEIPLMDPKEALFRIYRDIRFSPDKRPYKNHFGCFISNGGFKSSRPGYYLHLEPGESYLGGGIWMPPGEVLKAVRTAIYDHPEGLVEIIADPRFKHFFSEFEGEKLKRNPAGFPADFPHIALLLPKSYAVGVNLTDEQCSGSDFLNFAVDIFREVAKLNRFLNDALEQYL